MLLNSMQSIPKSQVKNRLRCCDARSRKNLLLRLELNKNTVSLIVEAGKLIQGSKQLSDTSVLRKLRHQAEGGSHYIGVVSMPSIESPSE